MSHAERILEDLRKIRLVIREEDVEVVPDTVVNYLFLNRNTIRKLVSAVYERLDYEQRKALLSDHCELDSSVLNDDDTIRKLVLSAVWTAERMKRGGSGYFEIDDDDVHMLMRSLEYAKYVPTDDLQLELKMSPIERYGLRRKIGNFESITQQEIERVSWELANIVYESEKGDLLDSMRKQGGNLEKYQIVLPNYSYLESLAKWEECILAILRFKAQSDLAIVLMDAPRARDKYLNTVVRRNNDEFLDFLSSLRKGISQLRESLAEDGHLKPLQLMELERDLDPIRAGYRSLAEEIGTMQPSPEIYLKIRQLKGEVKVSNYNFHGPVGAAGEHATATHFTQIWNESGNSIDLGQLTTQLERLRQMVSGEPESEERKAALASVQSASERAAAKDGPGVLHTLSTAGQWTLDFASKIGVDLVVAAIKQAIGIAS